MVCVCVLVALALPRSDLQICTTGTAAGNLGIIRKQLEGVSCPTWDELADLKQIRDCQFNRRCNVIWDIQIDFVRRVFPFYVKSLGSLGPSIVNSNMVSSLVVRELWGGVVVFLEY